eukprot:3116588-Rhodomonas_salina.1
MCAEAINVIKMTLQHEPALEMEVRGELLGQHEKKTSNCMDSLLASFGACEDSKGLATMIKAVYQVLDADDSGGLSFEEFRDGLQRLDVRMKHHRTASCSCRVESCVVVVLGVALAAVVDILACAVE